MKMRKFMFAALALMCAASLSMTSCRDKITQNKVNNRMENAKESANRALDKASDKMEAGADSVKNC